MRDALTKWVDEVLGTHSVAEHLPLNDRKAGKGQRVRRVEDSKRRGWILKEVAVAQEWRAEIHAYRNWIPAIADRAPKLLAANEALRVMLISQVPGTHPRPSDRAANVRAGELLRRFHQSGQPRPQLGSDREHAVQRLDRLMEECHEALTSRELAFVRSQAVRLAELPLGHKVPCHGDYRSHNWLLDGSKTLRVIDFGKSRWDVGAWDLSKLFLRPWWRRPQLAAAFLKGYGRSLEVEEAEFIEGRMTEHAVSSVAFGVKRGSGRHIDFGRSRLTELMAGHRVVVERLRVPE